MQRTQKNSIIKVDIAKVKTPKHVITRTPLSRLKELLEAGKKNGGDIREPITVVDEGSEYVAVNGLSVLQAALKTKQKKVHVLVIDSDHDAQVTHINLTDRDIVNPMSKALAIRDILGPKGLTNLMVAVVHLDKYYNSLVAMKYSHAVEKQLVNLINHAIEEGVANRPPITFFKTIEKQEDEAEQLAIIKNMDSQIGVAWTPNFVWTAEASKLLAKAESHVAKEKIPGKKTPSVHVATLEDGQEYSISEKDGQFKLDKVERRSTGDDPNDVMYLSTGVVDVKDVPILTEEHLKFLNNPKKTIISSFSSPEKFYKKYAHLNRPILVVMGKGDDEEE